jgi:hypothetical protein
MLSSEFIDAVLMYWLGFGTLAFIILHDSVNRFPQKLVFFIICGPIPWSFVFLKVVLSPFYRWLTKE